MFVSTEKTPYSELPRDCAFSESDWHALAGFWHPIGYSEEVGEKPIRATLLDVDIVLYRTNKGLTAAKDICMHRGAAMSLGWMDSERNNIICPFHGLHYDHAGQCTRIPSMEDQSKPIPKSIKLIRYQCCERYGLIWACLKEEEKCPMPDWPILEGINSDWTVTRPPVSIWETSAPRHVENFNDVAHFSFVHKGTFGNMNYYGIPNYEMWKTDVGLSLRMPYTEGVRARLGETDTIGERNVLYTKNLTYPFSMELVMEYEGEGESDSFTLIAYDIASPVSSRKTAVYQFLATNRPGTKPEDLIMFQNFVNSEDIPVVESQRPEELPLDISAEIHIPADKFSIQYRKDLVKLFNLGSPELTA
ncbi:MAG: Rieske 2Fe-2S domain-containing protein [Albidovulum sp.]|nr:Rieske 2Fe-2S domain-containing protein [Albidovulum sp.]